MYYSVTQLLVSYNYLTCTVFYIRCSCQLGVASQAHTVVPVKPSEWPVVEALKHPVPIKLYHS